MAKQFNLSFKFTMLDAMTAPMKTMSANMRGLGKSAEVATKKMSLVGKAGSELGGILKSNLFAMISIGSIIAFGNKSIEAFKKAEAAEANVRAGLISTKGVAKKSFEEIKKLSEGLMKNSFFGDDDIMQNVSAQMLTFTNITGTAFDRAQQAVLDVTAKLDGVNASGDGLKARAIQIGKALNDPIKGMGGLSRSGIQFSEQQKKQIELWVKSGQLGKAQTMMLNEIQTQYGGTAKALSLTSAGMARMRAERIDNYMEEIGKAIIPLKSLFLNFVEAIMPYVLQLVLVLKSIIITTAKWVKAVWGLRGVIVKLVAVLGAYYITTKAILALEWIRYLWMMRTVILGAVKAQWGLNIAMAANPIGLAVAGIVALAAIVYTLYENWDKVLKIIEKISKWWSDFKQNTKFDTSMLMMSGISPESIKAMEKINKSQTDINLKVTGDGGAQVTIDKVKQTKGKAKVKVQTNNGNTQMVPVMGF